MADEKTEIIGADLREFSKRDSMGKVTNTRYIRCVWPRLDEPKALFAKGSSGIEIQGPPTPRNVIFPDDTIALNVVVNDAGITEKPRWRVTDILTKVDCFFVREKKKKRVERERVFRKSVEVEPGLTQEVEYSKPVMVDEDVDEITDLTVEEAKARKEKPDA